MLTHRLDAGAPITGVQWLVGHTLLSTTARYVKPGFSAAVEALDSRRR
jgi:site-specific recombinase XerC